MFTALQRRAAGQAEQRDPECRSDDTIGKILGETFDCRARDARLIELGSITTNNMRDRFASGFKAHVERICDGANVRSKTALRRQARCKERENDQAGQGLVHELREEHRDEKHWREQNHQREHAIAPLVEIVVLFVEMPAEKVDERAKPYDRMADASQNGARIAERLFDRERQQREWQSEGKAHASERDLDYLGDFAREPFNSDRCILSNLREIIIHLHAQPRIGSATERLF